MPNRHSPAPRRPPPRAPVAPGTPLRAVLTGVSIDLCASKLLGLLVAMIYAAQVAQPGMTPQQVADALDKLPPQLSLMLLGGALGALVSVVAGYACARVARRDEFRVGAVMAGTSTLASLVLDGGGPTDELTLLYLLCDVACVMLGVKYGAAHNRFLDAPAAAPADARSP